MIVCVPLDESLWGDVGRWPYDEHPGDCHPVVVDGVWTVCCRECAGTGVWPVPWIATIDQGRDDPLADCVACKATGRSQVTLAAP